jgi:Rab-GTPase-TBC domain
MHDKGMNYLAGYIYLKTLNPHNAYLIFEYLMEKRFKEIFVKEFEVLKIKMYQFERLLDIFHP